jgi:hypothetical protein
MADRRLLDDRYVALSYHQDGAAFIVLDVASGTYFLMDTAGPDATSPIATNVEELLDWLWQSRITPKARTKRSSLTRVSPLCGHLTLGFAAWGGPSGGFMQVLDIIARIKNVEADHCVFRRDPATRSDATRPLIPTAPGHRFR